jgi:thiaminase
MARPSLARFYDGTLLEFVTELCELAGSIWTKILNHPTVQMIASEACGPALFEA